MSSFPDRGMWRVGIDNGDPNITQVPFAQVCAGCAPIIAVVTRDLDGDRELDIIGIDTRLGIYTALSTGDGKLARTLPIPDPNMTYTTIEASVTGMPR